MKSKDRGEEMKKLLIVHGGGPTAVINTSLYGAIKEALASPEIKGVYGANNGTGGVLKEEFISFNDVAEEKLEYLKQTPGSAIGTSRDQMEDKDYEAMARILEEQGFGYILFNGGNGTMDTCGKLYQKIQELGLDMKVMGIPKTTDNDIACIDHAPGFPSAARYIAQCTKELCADVKGLAIHVVVLEASGRNAGWITAASALAKDADGLGPDLIYVPEIPFDEEQFVKDVDELLKKKSGIVVVASEGLKDAEGNPIVEPIFKTGRATYFGDVSSHLANVIIRRLGYKARGEKPGLLGRTSIPLRSPIDVEEAEEVGRIAVREVLKGTSGKMVGIHRVSDHPYKCEYFTIEIEKVMLDEKVMPREYINESGNGVTEEYIEWLKPLLGEDLDAMATYNEWKPAERE